MSLEGKVIFITGASSGIGFATAKLLSEKGAKIMLTARREDRLKELRDSINSDNGEAAYQVVDVTKKDEVQKAVDLTIEKWGKIDVMFNNAGLMPLSFMDKLHVDEWDRMIDVNIKGVLYGIAAVLPNMKKRNSGHIINTSSIAGHKPFPGGAVYCATKFAVGTLTESLRMELQPNTKIKTTLISPGQVSTELFQSITDEDILNRFKSREPKTIPLKSETIAEAILYAISQPDEVDVNEIIVRPVTSHV